MSTAPKELEEVATSRLERRCLRMARHSQIAIWTLIVLLPAAGYQLVASAYRGDLDGLFLGAFAMLLADYIAKDWVYYKILIRQAERIRYAREAGPGTE